MKTTFVQAVCCEVSTKPGAANTTSFHGHLPERVKCATCGKEYSIDDNPADLNRIVDFANKLVVAARRAVNESHRLLGELHDLEIDRTSCTSFWANQLRVLLTAAAYVLMQELRLRAAGTACARAQVLTLRERLLKLGARVMGPVRRFVIHLPASFPFLPGFRLIACRLGAQSG